MGWVRSAVRAGPVLASLFLTGCLVDCGGDFTPPEPDACDRANPAPATTTLAIGRAGSDAFRPFRHGESPPYQTGGQGTDMIVLRLELAGEALPACASFDVKVRDEEGLSVGAWRGPLRTYESDPAVRVTRDLYVLLDSTPGLVQVIASVGSVQTEVWLGAVERCSPGCDPPCEAGERRCDGRCIDVLADPARCGSCGHACEPGEICTEGVCGCADGDAACECQRDGGLFCDGVCADPYEDPLNCGACGRACAADSRCQGGDCICTQAGYRSCEGTCVDVQTDPDRCGACDRSCAAPPDCAAFGGETPGCDGGRCRCAPEQCLCGGACVNRRDSQGNCGACGRQCPPGAYCAGAECTCGHPSVTLCPDGCFDLHTDAEHCGSCDVACAAGEVCVPSADGTTGACAAP